MKLVSIRHDLENIYIDLKSDYEKIEKGINGYFNPPSESTENEYVL